MARAIWRGNWATRLRLATGLILFTFAFFHFINIGLGLLDPVWMNGMQDARQVITRSAVGTFILYGALLIHVGLALTSLARRRTLRMPFNMGLQILLGLLIPLQLIPHVVHTRLAYELFGVNDEMSYLIVLMWPTEAVWWQSLLLLLVWIHGCIGLHLWLRLTKWWHRAAPYLIGLAVLIPAFAFAGLITEGRRMMSEFADDALRTAYIEHFNWPGEQDFATLFALKGWGQAVFWAALALTAAIYLGRKVWRRRHTVRIRYVEGPEIRSELGMTLLEMSRANAVPHTALCGGKGRCTTCRVIVEEGAELLHPPGETEARSLAAIGAPPTMRLACQIRPQHPSTVFRVFRPDGRKSRAHSSQGQERQLAVLFLDMRGFTERTVGQLPYDVVFLLNRFFDAIVPAITGAGGTVDKYLGDGLLAVFETRDAASSARAGLSAAMQVGRALERFNERLARENAPAIRIGMGLHLGNLVLGEIGAAGDAARTIVGDTVNVASRLEGQTKTLGVELLVSHEILRAVGIETDRLALREFELRGVSEPVRALPIARASRLEEQTGPLEHGSQMPS